MKGLVLAGGTGSRLWPITQAVSKQLLPVYDKPLVYFPISTLMLSGIREILIITTPRDVVAFQELLGDGRKFGIEFKYASQEIPNGLARAFTIGSDFIGQEKSALILGDNIFYGDGLGSKLQSNLNVDGAQIFAYRVRDPERYGVVEFNSSNKVTSIEEKPEHPKSNYAIPGLYFYDNSVIEIAKYIKPSQRGEYEITDVNREYLQMNKLNVQVLDRGTAWLDTGTFDSLQSASNYIRVIEERQGIKIACLEEVAWRKGWISDSQLMKLAVEYGNSPYANYLNTLLN